MDDIINFSEVTLVKGQRMILNFVGVDEETKAILSAFQTDVNTYLDTPLDQLVPGTEAAEDLYAAFCAFMHDNGLVVTEEDEDGEEEEFYPVLFSDVLRVVLNANTALFFATVTGLDYDVEEGDEEDEDEDEGEPELESEESWD